MVQQILKMGGCKTMDEFYRKYPTEESFLEVFPQARPMMEQFAKGGALDIEAFPTAAPNVSNYGMKTPNLPLIFQMGGGMDEQAMAQQDMMQQPMAPQMPAMDQANQDPLMVLLGQMSKQMNIDSAEILEILQNLPPETLDKLRTMAANDPKNTAKQLLALREEYRSGTNPVMRKGGRFDTPPTADQFYQSYPDVNIPMIMGDGGDIYGGSVFNYGQFPAIMKDGGTIPMNTQETFIPSKLQEFMQKVQGYSQANQEKEMMEQMMQQNPFQRTFQGGGGVTCPPGEEYDAEYGGCLPIKPVGTFQGVDVDGNQVSINPTMKKKYDRGWRPGQQEMSPIVKAEMALAGLSGINNLLENKETKKREFQMQQTLYDPMNWAGSYPTDKGDWDQFGNFRPDQRVFTGSFPMAQSGLEVKMRAGLGFNANQLSWPVMAGEFSEPDLEVKDSIGPIDRDEANLEAEVGETAVTNLRGDGIPEQYKIGGNRHYAGGTPLNLPDNSYIFSRDKSMKIKDKDLLAKEFGITSFKKGGITPADIAKRYDLNKYKKTLLDPNTDDLARSTAEANIKNGVNKLGKLALIQESMKSFPDGVPMISMPYMQSVGITPEMFAPQGQNLDNEGQPAQDMAKYGKSVKGLKKFQVPPGEYIGQPADPMDYRKQIIAPNEEGNYIDRYANLFVRDPYGRVVPQRYWDADPYNGKGLSYNTWSPNDPGLTVDQQAFQVYSGRPSITPNGEYYYPSDFNDSNIYRATPIYEDPYATNALGVPQYNTDIISANTVNGQVIAPRKEYRRVKDMIIQGGRLPTVDVTGIGNYSGDNWDLDNTPFTDPTNPLYFQFGKPFLDIMNKNTVSNVVKTGRYYDPIENKYKSVDTNEDGQLDDKELEKAFQDVKNGIESFRKNMTDKKGDMLDIEGSVTTGIGPFFSMFTENVTGLNTQDRFNDMYDVLNNKASEFNQAQTYFMDTRKNRQTLDSELANLEKLNKELSDIESKSDDEKLKLKSDIWEKYRKNKITKKYLEQYIEKVRESVEKGENRFMVTSNTPYAGVGYIGGSSSRIPSFNEYYTFITGNDYAEEKMEEIGPAEGTVPLRDSITSEIADTVISASEPTAPAVSAEPVQPPAASAKKKAAPTANPYGIETTTGVNPRVRVYNPADTSGAVPVRKRGGSSLPKMQNDGEFFEQFPEESFTGTDIPYIEVQARDLGKKFKTQKYDASKGYYTAYDPSTGQYTPINMDDFYTRQGDLISGASGLPGYDTGLEGFKKDILSRNQTERERAAEWFQRSYNKQREKFNLKPYFFDKPGVADPYGIDKKLGIYTWSAPGYKQKQESNTPQPDKPSITQGCDCRDPKDPTKSVPGTIGPNGNCVCPDDTTPPPIKTPPTRKTPFWTEDVINTGAALRNVNSIRKYLPWQAKAPFYAAEPTFESPERAISAQMEGLNIGAQSAAQFSNPQAFAANFSKMAGTAGANTANIIADVNNRNVQTANQFEMANKQAYNQYMQNQADRSTNMYDKWTIANQQFDNAKRQNEARKQVVNAWTNRGKTDIINKMYAEQFRINPVTGTLDFYNPKKFEYEQPKVDEMPDNLKSLYDRAIARNSAEGDKIAAAIYQNWINSKNSSKSGKNKSGDDALMELIKSMNRD